MTSTDHNDDDDLVNAHMKLEWIKPKIFVMRQKTSQGKVYNYGAETSLGEGMGSSWCGAFGVCGPS